MNIETGQTVIYGLHGKCKVLGVETRVIGDKTQSFIKLEVQKSTLSRSSKQEPAIWVPMEFATTHGLRPLATPAQAEDAIGILQSREHYFSTSEAWSTVQHKLEKVIRNEGLVGMAKVVSYLFVLKYEQVVPTPEVSRMGEQVYRHFLREMSDVLLEAPKKLETRFQKAMKVKLLPNQ